MARKSPTSLDVLQIVEPCHEAWQAMTAVPGEPARRHCDSCQKHVHDLANLSRAEGERLIAKGESICMRITRDAAGRVVTADERRRTHWQPFGRVAAMILTALGLGTLVNAGCDRAPDTSAHVFTTGDVYTPHPTTAPATQPAPVINDARQVMGMIAPMPTTRPAKPVKPSTRPAHVARR